MPGKALIVIDMQNDFCPGGSLAVNEGDLIIGRINELMKEYLLIAGTQDWHPAGHASFASSHEGLEIGEVVPVEGIDQYLWPDHCVQGTEGADFHKKLESDRFHLIIRKGWQPHLDSYSAFFENDGKTPTGLDGWLKDHGIKELGFCGLATDYCVYFSVRDAVNLGYGVTLYSDAVRGVDLPPGNVERSLADMKSMGVNIV